MTVQTTATQSPAMQRQPRPQFFRFSIRQLLIWTAAIAVACVALRSSSPEWISLANAIALMSLAAAIPLAVYRAGPQRAFWIGFAVCGWIYVALLYLSLTLPAEQRRAMHLSHNQLLTTRLSKWAYRYASPYTADRNPVGGYGGMSGMPGGMEMSGGMMGGGMPGEGGMGMGGMSGYGSFGPMPALAPSRAPENEFVLTANAIWTLILAACGGSLARWLYLTREREAD